jgi:hypothetical protein
LPLHNNTPRKRLDFRVLAETLPKRCTSNVNPPSQSARSWRPATRTG